MDISYYKKYEPIFGEWHIVKKIGEGAYGSVFEIERYDFGITYKAALKIISIPQSENEIKSIRAEGADEQSVRDYFREIVGDFVKEISLMSEMKGNSNIVSYENHKVVQHEDGIGWDILIQMELLTPLVDYIGTHTLEEKDIRKLGIDLCRALVVCHKNNIIHRDIKPDNIFISKNGDFKIGDFGIARTAEKTMSGLSRKGTLGYMAPEVFNGSAYGQTVDLYSLGLVLYYLCNNNRLPFYPNFPEKVTYSDKENASHRRMSGEAFPNPINFSKELANIIFKACAFHPVERYRSAEEMLKDLEGSTNVAAAVTAVTPTQTETFEKSVVETKTEVEETVMLAESEQQTVTEETVILTESEVTEYIQQEAGNTKSEEVVLPRTETNKTETGSDIVNEEQRNTKSSASLILGIVLVGIVILFVAKFVLPKRPSHQSSGENAISHSSDVTEPVVSETEPVISDDTEDLFDETDRVDYARFAMADLTEEEQQADIAFFAKRYEEAEKQYLSLENNPRVSYKLAKLYREMAWDWNYRDKEAYYYELAVKHGLESAEQGFPEASSMLGDLTWNFENNSHMESFLDFFGDKRNTSDYWYEKAEKDGLGFSSSYSESKMTSEAKRGSLYYLTMLEEDLSKEEFNSFFWNVIETTEINYWTVDIMNKLILDKADKSIEEGHCDDLEKIDRYLQKVNVIYPGALFYRVRGLYYILAAETFNDHFSGKTIDDCIDYLSIAYSIHDSMGNYNSLLLVSSGTEYYDYYENLSKLGEFSLDTKKIIALIPDDEGYFYSSDYSGMVYYNYVQNRQVWINKEDIVAYFSSDSEETFENIRYYYEQSK